VKVLNDEDLSHRFLAQRLYWLGVIIVRDAVFKRRLGACSAKSFLIEEGHCIIRQSPLAECLPR
jgi:hypothetical protein